MIDAGLSFVQRRLNTWLKHVFDDQEPTRAVLGRFVDPAQEAQDNIKDKVVIQLIRLEQTTMPHQARQPHGSGSPQAAMSSPVYLNLYLLICANFSAVNYEQALAYLSRVVEFFQVNAVFDRQNSPDLPEGMQKLCFDIEDIGPHDLGTIWGMLGSKYQPSVIYKVRLLTFDGQLQGVDSSVSAPQRPQAGHK